MVKLMGMILIMISSSGIGFLSSEQLKKRCKLLRYCKQMIYQLRGEIKCAKAPLEEAFFHVSERMVEPFSLFLKETSKEMELYNGKTLAQIWSDNIETYLGKDGWKKEDQNKLKILGEGLGYLDVEMQLSTIELYLEQLEQSMEEAKEELRTKQKLYQGLGMATGIFLVIILV